MNDWPPYVRETFNAQQRYYHNNPVQLVIGGEMPKVIAQITTDHLYNKWSKQKSVIPTESNKDKEFHWEALVNYMDMMNLSDDDLSWIDSFHVTTFKLYDDDDELYYSGWLINDDEALVQQFVLEWAMADSGCTRILVYNEKAGNYVQEIG